jgi:hypothetical protein
MFLYLKKLHIYLLTKCNFAEATWQAIAPHFNHQWGGGGGIGYCTCLLQKVELKKGRNFLLLLVEPLEIKE